MRQTYNEIVNELKNMKKTANDIAKEVQKMEENITGVPETKEKKNHSHDGETMISFASYEMQAERFQYEKEDLLDRYEKEKTDMRDRFEKEKDKMRKNYHHIIAWISSALIALLLIAFGSAFWLFYTYDLMSFTQDGDGINNYAYNTEQGDWTYEPKNQADSAS